MYTITIWTRWFRLASWAIIVDERGAVTAHRFFLRESRATTWAVSEVDRLIRARATR